MHAALIDLFDTLVWSEWRILRGRIAETIGVDDEILRRAYDVTYTARQTGLNGSAAGDMAALLEACGLKPDPAVVDELVRLIERHLGESVHLYEDAVPTLRALRERGVRTALVSNCDHFAGPMVQDLGLDDEIDTLVLSYAVGWHKPQPEIYRTTLDALGVRPEQAIFVDDQPAYLDGAAELGIATRYIRRSNEPWEGHHDPGRHQVITALTALL